jgi:hypothetical protein
VRRKTVARRQHSVADVFYKALNDPEFFQALLTNPEASIKQAGFALSQPCLKQLMEELADIAKKESLVKMLEAIRALAYVPWKPCPPPPVLK